MEILVAEDDAVSLRIIVSILKKQGYDIITAINGRDAIEYLNKEGLVDLIISDIMMPEIDGLGLLNYVKSNKKFKNIPVILTTALNDQKTVMKAMKIGVAGFLVKPFTKEILIPKINNIIDSLPGSILIVDDEDVIKTLLKRIIENDGYKVVNASNGNEALDIIEKQNISVVVSDIKMPGMSGVELLKAIKSKYVQMQVLLMTGNSLEFSKEKAMASGADGFIAKPFNSIEILEKISLCYSNQKKSAKV
ncbi:MAG: response regulator [candidate division Zixibacteria bacterium]|nr:response regulator [candidate division Zixibacteria bacterium]